MRLRNLCECVLQGRAYYTRRCPVCGRHRDAGHYQHRKNRTREDLEEERRLIKEHARRMHQSVIKKIAHLNELCEFRMAHVPPKPVPTQPSRTMTPKERAEWEMRAEYWQKKRTEELLAYINEPVSFFEGHLTGTNSRYTKAGARILDGYHEFMVSWGWPTRWPSVRQRFLGATTPCRQP